MVENSNNQREYAILVSEPYLTRDWFGKYVILQEESVFSAPKKNIGVDQCYTTEVLVNADPSEEEIFKMKLKGEVRKSVWNEPKQNKV